MSDKLTETISPLTPNIVTIIRIILVFITVVLFTLNTVYAIIAFLLTIIVIYMDALDGYLARKLKAASKFGALFDIAGDRIVENIFWIFFATRGEISYWVPIVFVTRGFLVDMVRSMAFTQGKTPFGEKTMMRSKLTRFLVSSPFSRSFYAVNKVLAFAWLGGLIAIHKGIVSGFWSVPTSWLSALTIIGHVLVYSALIMCIIRALPVFWDGKEFIYTKQYPQQFRKED